MPHRPNSGGPAHAWGKWACQRDSRAEWLELYFWSDGHGWAEKHWAVIVTTEERVFEFRAVNREERRREKEKCRIMVYIEEVFFLFNFPLISMIRPNTAAKVESFNPLHKVHKNTARCTVLIWRNFPYWFFTGVLPIFWITHRVKINVCNRSCPGRKLPVSLPFFNYVFLTMFFLSRETLKCITTTTLMHNH